MNQKPLFKPPKRVIIFIDGNNLFHRMWALYRTHLLDIQEFANKLCNVNRKLVQIRYYYSPFIRQVNSKTWTIQQKYIQAISQHSNVQLIEGKYIQKPILLKRSLLTKILTVVAQDELKTYIEKGIDVQIAVDMIKMALEDAFDTAILVSGDSDFVPVITQLKKFKKSIQVAAFSDNITPCFDLINHCRKSFVNLHHIIPSMLKKQKSRNP